MNGESPRIVRLVKWEIVCIEDSQFDERSAQ
jgi:hypothetical protein